MTNVLWVLLLIFIVIVGLLSALSLGTLLVYFIAYIHDNIKNILKDLMQG